MLRQRLFSTILIMALVLIGLSLSVVGVTAREPTVPSADTDIVINEVYYLGNSAAEDWIELKNVGSETIDVSSWVFCARFSYSFQTLAGLTLLDGNDLILGPGEIITLQAWTNLDNTSSDLGLYISTSFTSPSAMVDFVQWGTADDVGRSDVAAAKGIWTETTSNQYDFVDTAGTDQSMAYDGSNGGGGLLTLSSDFSNGTPTRGAENTSPDIASLEVSKKASSSTVEPNELITYTLTVSSSGTISNTNVVLTDTIPSNSTFASADVTPVDGVLTWTLGDMPPLAVITRTFAVTADEPGGTIIVNDDYGVQSDQDAASGPPVEVSVLEGPPPPTATLAVSKKASSSIIKPNELITYTLTVTSEGTISNTNVVLSDTIPLSTTLAFADVSPVDDVLTWDLGEMPPSTVITRTFVVTASAPGGTSLLPSGTVIINDDYGVQSDQDTASGPPVEVSVVVADKFIYLPIVLRSSAP